MKKINSTDSKVKSKDIRPARGIATYWYYQTNNTGIIALWLYGEEALEKWENSEGVLDADKDVNTIYNNSIKTDNCRKEFSVYRNGKELYKEIPITGYIVEDKKGNLYSMSEYEYRMMVRDYIEIPVYSMPYHMLKRYVRVQKEDRYRGGDIGSIKMTEKDKEAIDNMQELFKGVSR